MVKLVEEAVRDLFSTLVGKWILGLLSAAVFAVAGTAIGAYRDSIVQSERTQSAVAQLLDGQREFRNDLRMIQENVRLEVARVREELKAVEIENATRRAYEDAKQPQNRAK